MTRKTEKETVGNKAADNGRERWSEAAENYRRIEQKIAPFVRSRKFERYSTAGRWSSGPAATPVRSSPFGLRLPRRNRGEAAVCTTDH